MKVTLLSAILVSILLFAGCGNSPTIHTGSPVGPFVAAVGQTSDNLLNFKATDSGAISPISSSATGHAPSAVLIQSPNTFQHNVYVTDSASNNLTLFNMDSSSGALTPTGTSVSVGSNPMAIADFEGPLAPNSTQPQFGFIYVLNQGSKSISVFQVTDSMGHLSAVPGSPFPTQVNPQAITVTSIGSPSAFTVFVYVANGALGSISGFRANADGSLTEVAGSPFSAGANISWVAGRGPFIYASDAGNNAIVGLAVQANGSLTPVSGSPFTAGSQPGAIGPGLDRFLYVVNRGNNTVSGYTVDFGAGALTPIAGSTFSTGSNPVYVAEGSNGQRLYVANQGSSSISTFTKDPNTGMLTPVSGSHFQVATSPNWLDTLFIMNVD
jgi:6-phosphogluconolactonase (cycloisomerase 2 family)